MATIGSRLKSVKRKSKFMPPSMALFLFNRGRITGIGCRHHSDSNITTKCRRSSKVEVEDHKTHGRVKTGGGSAASGHSMGGHELNGRGKDGRPSDREVLSGNNLSLPIPARSSLRERWAS